MNIIYSGIYDIGWEYYSGDQKWAKICRETTERYADAIGADFQYSENSEDSDSMFNTMRRYIPGLNTWSIATFIKLLAVNKFVNSDYSKMCWVDSDIYIQNNGSKNIFESPEGIISIDNFYPSNDDESVKGFIVRVYADLEYNTACNSGLFVLDKTSAIKYLSVLQEHTCNILNTSHLENINLFFKNKNKTPYISDEAVMEVVINTIGCAGLPQGIKTQYFYKPEQTLADRDYTAFCLHFQSGLKKLIEGINA
jgi:hypothetical protein